MKKTARQLALEILNQISRSQTFAQPLLDEAIKEHHLSQTADGRLLTHLVYGTLRMRGHLDWLIGGLYHGNFTELDEGIKNILRLGLYQLKFSDRLPAFAVVDEAVKLAKIDNPAKGSLVNAILRNYLRRGSATPFPDRNQAAAEYIAAFHSHPLWLVRKWLKQFGEKETIDLCRADNELPPITLRVNTLKISRNELQQKLAADGVTVKATAFSPDGLIVEASEKPIRESGYFQEGYLRLQDEGAQLIAQLMGVQASDAVLDICAGTGGKTTHLAALMQNKGKIVALDYNAEKIGELRTETARLGINNIVTQLADLQSGLPASLAGQFDRVLLDAPCSGLGTLRRNPEIKWRTNPADIAKFAATQRKFLKAAAQAVKKGGSLVYCTCSLLPEENEDVIYSFLKKNTDFSLFKPNSDINRKLIDSAGFFRTFPNQHQTDGFFAALLQRK